MPVYTEIVCGLPKFVMGRGRRGGGGAHWRHLANAAERFVRDGDAVLRQSTLTTRY